jgi:formiminotetrahydrofolate cyclodeaminase
LRAEVAPLAQADADAYTEFMRNRSDPAARERTIELPARLAELALEIAQLAAEAAERGKPVLRGDAAAGALLAEAAARTAANLVVINGGPADRRVEQSRLAADAASACAARATAAAT